MVAGAHRVLRGNVIQVLAPAVRTMEIITGLGAAGLHGSGGIFCKPPGNLGRRCAESHCIPSVVLLQNRSTFAAVGFALSGRGDGQSVEARRVGGG